MATSSGTDRRDLLLAGHVNVDRFLGVDRFPAADRTVPVRSGRIELGGTAANAARVAASFGVSTGLLALLGDGFPAEFLRTLREARIDVGALVRVRGVPTPTCLIVEDRRHRQRTFIDQGPMEAPGSRGVSVELLRRYSWLHLATGSPEWQLRLCAAARRAGTRTAADPAQEIHYRWDRGRLRRLLSGSEILFGNRSEIARACSLTGTRAPLRLVDRVPLVVRTEGPEGVSAFSRVGTTHAAAGRPRRIRTLTGAGDAFRGGFYAGWFAGQDLTHCLKAGSRASTIWIERGPPAPSIRTRAKEPSP